MRQYLLVAVVGALLSSAGQLTAALNDEIVTETTAQRYGLTRAWITQAQVNQGQSRLQSVVLIDGVIYAQSSRATLEAIDAETGQKLWSKMIGQPRHPSFPPGACRDLVASINGATLYVLNRYTGDILYQTVVNGAPGSSPAVSTRRVYVPMVAGMIVSYRLAPVTDPAKELGKISPGSAAMSAEEKKEAAKRDEEERRENIRIQQAFVSPLYCNSTGRTLVAPVVTTQNRDQEFVAWGTDRGYLYLGCIDRRSDKTFVAKYRRSTTGFFSSPLAYMPPDPKVTSDSGVIYGGSSDGYVYAMQERTGELQWKFPASDPVIDSPVLIGNRLYVTTELGGMFCLNAKTGVQLWWAPDLLHFVAAGKQRVYAADKLDRLRILDARTGATLDSVPTTAIPIKISNDQTDRIYLATEGGTIQCLREVEQVNPLVYNANRKPPPDDEPPPPPRKIRSKSGDSGAKPAQDRPPPKKPTAKKDDSGGDSDAAADKPAKPAKGKAGDKAKAVGKGKKAADADADNLFDK